MESGLTFHLIPHTHWDREWYLTRAGFQARLVPAIESIVSLLAREPDARFVLDGQTILIEDALQVRPDLRGAIGDAVRSGRLEIGPWYVLADEQIPNGESLVRNLLAGARDAAAFGARMNVCYSPDAFGHPAAMPMLARGFGIDTGVVWRGLAQSDQGDRDLRSWASPDGQEMLLYHLPPSGYEVGVDLAEDGAAVADRWSSIRDHLVERAVTSHVAVFVGADHHAPPPSLTAIRDQLRRVEPSHEVRLSSLTEYFDAVRSSWGTALTATGELRWSHGHTWTLQGVHSTRARMKRVHGVVEHELWRQVEPLVALASLFDDTAGPTRTALLRYAWRKLLAGQFHDTLGGCCSDAVADEQATRLASAHATARETRRAALHLLTDHDADLARSDPERVHPTLILWNPVPRARQRIIIATVTVFRRDVLVGPPSGRAARTGTGYAAFALRCGDSDIPVQIIERETVHERIDAPHRYPDQDEVDRITIAFQGRPIGGLAFRGAELLESDAIPEGLPIVVGQGRLANAFIAVTASDVGSLSIVDLRTGERLDDLLRFEDESDDGDTYTPAIRTDVVAVSNGTPISQEVRTNGPLIGQVETVWSLAAAGGGVVSCRAVITLLADSPIVRVQFDIDNYASNHRLRFRCPIGVGDVAVAGAAFGVERRAPVDVRIEDFAAEFPSQTAPAHRFVAAGAGQRALAVFAPGFFEYEWTPGGDLLVTLMRSVGELSRHDLPARPGHAGWPVATPNAQEHGRHRIEMALAPVTSVERSSPAMLEQMWEEVFVPVDGTFLRDYTGQPSSMASAGIELDGEGLAFSACKPAESGRGVILRCYNLNDRRTAGAWRVGQPIGRASLVRLDESNLRELPVSADGEIAFEAGVRAVVTILIEPLGGR